jgi:hypothetical protein
VGGRQVSGVSQAVWEDDEHVLAILSEGADQGMVRAGLDGRLEQVTQPVQPGELSVELWFAERSR